MTYPMPPQGPKRSPWASPAVIVAIVVGLLVLAGGVVGALVYANSHSDETETASPGESASTTVETRESGGTTVTVTRQPTHRPTGQEPTATAAPPPTSHSSPSVSGADWQGFSGSDARCNADDAAVFIGYTSRSQVVVCQVGSQTGRNYYKGAADGGSIEIDFPTRSGDTFTAVNEGTTYAVSTSSLVITEPDGTPHVESMIQAWAD